MADVSPLEVTLTAWQLEGEPQEMLPKTPGAGGKDAVVCHLGVEAAPAAEGAVATPVASATAAMIARQGALSLDARDLPAETNDREVAMTKKVYQLPVEKTGWQTQDKSGTATFTWEYDDVRDKLINLYDKGKRKQWDAATRIDWSHSPDLENPLQVPDEIIPIFGSPVWDKLTEAERGNVRRHLVGWQFSQFLHGEQGALICTAKIVQTVPDIDSKFYAATQVMDEARHVETYNRYLDKIETSYPINYNLKSLLDDVLSDSRWDMTYLGMQVLIEGLALAAFGLIRNTAGDPLGKAVNAYVMQDEARHVMFGRLALRDYYPQLTQAERDDREEFCADACYRMRDRFLGEELWQCLGYDPEDCIEYVENSETQRVFRSLLFARIVPTLKDVGLWGPKMRQTFADMGVIGYETTDLDEVMADDERIAEEIDAMRRDDVDLAVADGIAAADD